MIAPGKTYVFRVKARNAIGYSEDSIDFSILAATKPPVISAPVLSPTLADSVVYVDWESPADQLAMYGTMITAYKVYVRQTDGIFYSELATDCPKSDANLVSNTMCTVQIATLKAYPFSL